MVVCYSSLCIDMVLFSLVTKRISILSWDNVFALMHYSFLKELKILLWVLFPIFKVLNCQLSRWPRSYRVKYKWGFYDRRGHQIIEGYTGETEWSVEGNTGDEE